MLAQRLASRTVISSERDVGTQTSLSFETSSSIRNELLLYLEEQGMLDDQEQEQDKDKDSNADGRSYVRGVGEMTIEELRAMHYSHLLDPNYDAPLLARESATLSRWDRDPASRPPTLATSHHRPPLNPQPGDPIPLSFYSNTNTEGPTSEHNGGWADDVDAEVYTDWGFDEGEEDSVYAEVRAAVANTDDPTMPTNTLRVWVLGLLGSILLSGVNQFFYFRYPSVNVAALVIQLVCYPLGIFMAHLLPHGSFINPGPFNIKEHTLITIMAGVAQGNAYATNILVVQKKFYNQDWSFAYKIMLVCSTQLIGFSMGGILRRFLVWPAAMIWPASLVNTALLNTLHSISPGGITPPGEISRDRFFYRVTAAMFVWTWIPSYLVTATSNFDWVTWIAPKNVIVNQIFGYNHGLGLSLITLDWGLISTYGNPLATPWWTCANMGVGFIAFVCILYPSLYYTGAFDAWYLPFAGSRSYDNMGNTYNISRILIQNTTKFNETGYVHYSEIFVPITFTMGYAMSFACLMATLVHTALYYRGAIWTQAWRGLHDETDIHSRLMRKYREVPLWWYGAIFVVNLAMALAVVCGWETDMPPWTLFLSLFIAFFFALPVGIVQAVTNQQGALNVISELIIGYINPGKPISMMIFKTYSYITLSQGLNFVSDMKMGHYMKIPPRIMFHVQVAAAVTGCFVQVGVDEWMYAHIKGLCDPDINRDFWCPSAQTFGVASILWGLIGPARQFSPGKMYGPIFWGFFAGTLAPFPFYFLAKRNPTKWYKFVNWPVIFSVTALMPPYLPINIISYIYTNFIFQYLVRKYRFVWWSRFNYILSAGWSAGYAVAVIVIFFAFVYPSGGRIGEHTIQSWWGNNVYNDTADSLGLAYKTLEQGKQFGRKTWWKVPDIPV